MTASTITGLRASMIAEVRPQRMAIGRNVAPSTGRFGMPKDTLPAPRVMLTPNSSRISAIVSSVLLTSVVSAPIGIASGSMTMSASGISYCPTATSMILRVISSRLRGSSGISSSSLGSAITAAP